jgi:hypothetical protein
MGDASSAAYDPAMSEPAEIARAVAGLLAPDGQDGVSPWWQAGIDDALGGAAEPLVWRSALVQSSGGEPLRKSCGTDRP